MQKIDQDVLVFKTDLFVSFQIFEVVITPYSCAFFPYIKNSHSFNYITPKLSVITSLVHKGKLSMGMEKRPPF